MAEIAVREKGGRPHLNSRETKKERTSFWLRSLRSETEEVMLVESKDEIESKVCEQIFIFLKQEINLKQKV